MPNQQPNLYNPPPQLQPAAPIQPQNKWWPINWKSLIFIQLWGIMIFFVFLLPLIFFRSILSLIINENMTGSSRELNASFLFFSIPVVIFILYAIQLTICLPRFKRLNIFDKLLLLPPIAYLLFFVVMFFLYDSYVK